MSIIILKRLTILFFYYIIVKNREVLICQTALKQSKGSQESLNSKNSILNLAIAKQWRTFRL